MASPTIASVSNTATTALLKKIKFLSGVEDALLQVLAKKIQKRRYPANTALFHAGDPGLILYMVVSGWVRIEKVTASGQLLIIGRRGPGSQLGELALLDGAPRMAGAKTDTDCELMVLDRNTFLKCLADSPTASLAVMASLAEMVRSAGASLESYRTLDVLGRLAQLLLHYCEMHGRATRTGEVYISRALNHQMLAEEVGATRESVSRCLAVMIGAGAIKKQGHKIIVLDLEKLQSMMGST